MKHRSLFGDDGEVVRERMILFLDTETTGLPRNRSAPYTDVDNWPRLVQIAWMVFTEPGEKRAEHSSIIRPDGYTIPLEAARVHGISTEKALAEGRDLFDVLEEFALAVEKVDLIVAHNMKFDEPVIASEYIRTGIPNRFLEKPRICTMNASTEFCQIPGPYGFKWPTLPELHHCLFKETFEEVHEASADVRICAKCFFELKHIGVL